MLSLLSVVLRHKRAILIVTIAGFAVSALVSLLLPSRYVATTVFVPISIEKDITGLRDFFAPLGSFGEVFAGYLRARKNYIIDFFIRSRRMSEIMDARFDLKKEYGVSEGEQVRVKLREHTAVVIRNEGVIILSVEDRDRARALAMTKEYLAVLDSVLIDLAAQSSQAQAEFLTGEVVRQRRKVAVTDSLLNLHLKQYGLYDMEEQVRVMLDIVSDLSSRLSVLDVEKKLLEVTMKPGSDELDKVDLQWNKLREQLFMLREVGASPGLFPPLKKLPEISARYVHLVGDRRIEEFVLGYLQMKLADANVSSNSRVSVLRVIDPPAAPEQRAWPKRKQIVMVSTAAAFFWACFFMIVWERWKAGAFRVADPAAAYPGGTGDAGRREGR